MEIARRQLYEDIEEFAEQMEQIDVQDEKSVVRFCNKVQKYLADKELICRGYQMYQNGWKAFEENAQRNPGEKSLYELLVYLAIYQREDYWTCSYEYGRCYVRAFQNGTIPCIIRELKRRLEIMAQAESDERDRTGSVGIAGEYFVMAELTRRGYVASLTSKNTKAIDLLVSDKAGNRVAAIQVKTCDNPKQVKWKMSNSAEECVSKNLYYVFVNMNGGNEPSYYIVPGEYVAYRLKEDYERWLNTPGKRGQQHNETTMRTFAFMNEDEAEQYRDAWFILGI